MKLLKPLIVLCFPSFVFAQISRNQWLVGGGLSGRYQESSTTDYKQKNAVGYEDVGYFVLNGLAVGVRGAQRYDEYFTMIDIYYNPFPVTTKEFSFSAGPFVRYYLFPETTRFNFYSEFYYGYGSTKTNYSSARLSDRTDNSHTYNLNIAPVFLINQHASVQLVAGCYYQTRQNITFIDFMVGIGLQMHLGKGKS